MKNKTFLMAWTSKQRETAEKCSTPKSTHHFALTYSVIYMAMMLTRFDYLMRLEMRPSGTLRYLNLPYQRQWLFLRPAIRSPWLKPYHVLKQLAYHTILKFSTDALKLIIRCCIIIKLPRMMDYIQRAILVTGSRSRVIPLLRHLAASRL